MKKHIQYIAVIGVLGVAGVQTAHAQIKEEKLVLNRKREPEVKKIEKRKLLFLQKKTSRQKGRTL